MLRRYFKILSILISPTLLSIPTDQKNFILLAPTSKYIKTTIDSKIKPSIPAKRHDIVHLTLDEWDWTEEDLFNADSNNFLITDLILRFKKEKSSPDMMQVIEAWRVIAKKEKELFKKLVKKEGRGVPAHQEILEELDLTVYDLLEMETTFSELLLRQIEEDENSFVEKTNWLLFEKEAHEIWWKNYGYDQHKKELDRKIDAGLAAMKAAETSL